MSTRILKAALPALALCVFLACEKEVPPPAPPAAPFSILFDNSFNALEAHYAAFLSNEDGELMAFRWLPGSDTASLSVPGSSGADRFDCTVVKITTFESLGARDTLLSLSTYSKVGNGETIGLNNLNFNKTTDLTVQLTGMNTLDTIIVPDGLTFARPLPGNSFTGQYRVLHTGKIWLRILIDGDPHWRYMFFDNINESGLNASIDATLLPALFTPPLTLPLPYLAPWRYNIDGIIDTASRQFLALGDLIRAPGGAIPVLNKIDLIQPLNLSFKGYRVNVSGTDPATGSTYQCDRFYDFLPQSLPTLNFDIEPASLADDRLVSMRCTGAFDALVINRTAGGTPGLSWTAYVAPEFGGIQVHRLPDVPAELGNMFPKLKNYLFDSKVNVRAESYGQFNSFEAFQRTLLKNQDPLWRPRAVYLGRERAL